jgi:hypothetical protein
MAIDMTPLDRPDTSTGVNFETVVPSPSWRKRLLPQHFAAPVDSKTHVWPPPTLIEPCAVALTLEVAVSLLSAETDGGNAPNAKAPSAMTPNTTPNERLIRIKLHTCI